MGIPRNFFFSANGSDSGDRTLRKTHLCFLKNPDFIHSTREAAPVFLAARSKKPPPHQPPPPPPNSPPPGHHLKRLFPFQLFFQSSAARRPPANGTGSGAARSHCFLPSLFISTSQHPPPHPPPALFRPPNENTNCYPGPLLWHSEKPGSFRDHISLTLNVFRISYTTKRDRGKKDVTTDN